ncbi:MAG: YbaK/EbsC family protein [Anaerorhabdus sp.]|uniref:YbaK/EbsC family protein n=1 Tax=Anaerorhabdus sp. TaxID=1872524 RepID=UPI003A894762
MKYDLLKIMDNLEISYQYIEHEPIVDYATAHAVDEKFNLKGTESKNLVLKDKKGNFYVLVTEEGVRFDRAFMKEVTGEKLSIVSPEELEDKTSYVVGCATNFGYDSDVTLVIDEAIYNNEYLICSAGSSTQSFVIKTEDLKKIYATCDNKLIYVIVPRNQER